MKTIETLDNRPFRRLITTIGALPTSFIDSMSYYEMLAWFCDFLQNTVIPAVNDNAEALAELQRLFVELKEYVDNYFDNLDVQDEIDNKLDEMVEQGTLQEIIAEYLNSKAVFGFDSVADMIASTNLIDGSYARTYGYYAANDGGAGYYKIREVTNTDTEDNGSIIRMTNSNLVAELIFEDNTINVKQFGCKGDDETDDTVSMQTAINYCATNNIRCHIPDGTYLVSKLTISNTIFMYGNGSETVIKSIDNNNESAIIYVENNGLSKSFIKDFTIDGNRTNLSSPVNGIELKTTVAADYFGNLSDIFIRNCKGNGLKASATSGAGMKEMRLENICVSTCDESGFDIDNMHDSFINKCTIAGCKKYGFKHTNAGSNKYTNCKAFWCGIGDGTTVEDGDRIPTNAFSVTSDAAPQPSKYYYTRSGTDTENDYYVFTRYTGESFDPAATYYELTTFYPKRYAGFYFDASATLITGCESQDNYGDGFIIKGGQNKLGNVTCDNNGLITDSSNNPVSYASQSKTQLYYGLYVNGWNFYATSCNFINTQYSNIGACQKGPAYIYGGGDVTVNGTLSNQVVATILVQHVQYVYLVSSVINNKQWVANLPFSEYLTLASGFAFADTNNNYLRYANGYVYYRISIKKSDDSGVLNGTTATNVLTLKEDIRPSTRINTPAMMSDNGGQVVKGYATGYFETWGYLYARHTDNSLDSAKQFLVEGMYRVK